VKYGTGVLQQQRHQLAEKADRCVGTADFERIVQMFGSIDSWSIISYGMCQTAKSGIGVLGEGSHHFWAAKGCGERCKFSQWDLGRSQPPNGFSLYLSCNYFFCTILYTKWCAHIKCVTVTQVCYAFYTSAVTHLRGYALTHFIPNHVPRFIN